jgi:flagellar biosynthesis/type III secretory pathway protein FliH
MLKHLTEFNSPPEGLNDEIFTRLFETAAIANLSESELEEYERSLKVFRDNYSAMKTAIEKGHSAGWAEGLVEGEAIGMEKGEAIGMEKGEAIGMEKGEAIGLQKGEAIGMEKGEAIGMEKGEAKMIRALYNNGMSIEQIEASAGLSREKIIEIINPEK